MHSCIMWVFSLALMPPPLPVSSSHSNRRGASTARMDIDVRAAHSEELRSAELAYLCADCLFQPAGCQERNQLSVEMSKNLVERFSALNDRQHCLLIAEDTASGRIVGSCGVEAAPVTPEGRLTPKLSTDAARMCVRPLLSNLSVDKGYRRRGIAKWLMCEAEARARWWGYDEMLLKVEEGNTPAEQLYSAMGYHVTGVDQLAERPQPGVFRVRWIRTSNTVMRKDLTAPSVQNMFSSVPILRGL